MYEREAKSQSDKIQIDRENLYFLAAGHDETGHSE